MEDENLIITFDSNGGSSVKEQFIKKNDLITIPTPPTKKGHTFICWELNGKEFDFATKVKKTLWIRKLGFENPYLCD